MGLAIFGGTFDPVHFGHLRSAVEVRQALGVEQVKLIPVGIPAHRESPGSRPEQRLEMLRLGIAGLDYLQVDSREIARGGTSYMMDTLESIREEVGAELSLSLVMGADAFGLIHQWYRWQELVDVAHLVVLRRPYTELTLNPRVRAWVNERQASADQLLTQPAGLICHLQLTQLDISATQIRQLVKAGQPIEYLLPAGVIDYIRQQALYAETT